MTMTLALLLGDMQRVEQPTIIMGKCIALSLL